MAVKKSKRQKNYRTYWPRCQVCQFMKSHKDYRARVMQSTYLNPEGKESLSEVNRLFGEPFPIVSVYMHMRRHQASDMIKAKQAFNIDRTKKPVFAELVNLNETAPVTNGNAHELGLDEFIREGRAKLKAGELPITATTYLQAIKIRADIEKSTKDRRLDALKQMFGGAAPNDD